ncbi:MAG: hydrogenase formation protein HypD [Anaerohalosphaeraceae bacterium]|nr:hydrogenase formation protein HypD [Anaerohalosphaeraceae bacterium]
MLERINRAYGWIDKACKTLGRPVNIMEVCGTHTVNIFRSGLRSAMPDGIKLLSGPGCPVCVTDRGYIDTVLELAGRDDCIIATYGDMIRVPGSKGSLEELADKGNVKVVLSAEDALGLAKNNPEKIVVFVAVGFETTTPATGIVVGEAEKEGVDNFCVFSNHKMVIPAMRALLSSMNHKIDAFLCPGHVSVIIGTDAYACIVEEFGRTCVVAGFEPMQIIEGIAAICEMLACSSPGLGSIYGAAVKPAGNVVAMGVIEKYFDLVDGNWRGLGEIPASTLKLKEKYSQFDAEKRFAIDSVPDEDLTGCRCGEVLCGLIDPPECQLFDNGCNPDKPIGPCMVSSEGACAAWYKYGRKRKRRTQ